ncbi:MAG: cytochrome c [Chitinophagales bacterium]|nr:cytochrome c [Chitinophagales bacterium]
MWNLDENRLLKIKVKNRKKQIVFIVGVVITVLIVLKMLLGISTNTGQQSYEQYCASCHGKQGEGFLGLVPPLANTEWLYENYKQIPCVIKNGIKDTIIAGGQIYTEEMLGLPQLNEIQIANISNYIISHFSEQSHFFTEQAVKDALKNCK